MKVEIAQGETLEIGFKDSDGSLTISYGGIEVDKLTIDSELPDSTGRVGRVYEEDYGAPRDPTTGLPMSDIDVELEALFKDLTRG